MHQVFFGSGLLLGHLLKNIYFRLSFGPQGTLGFIFGFSGSSTLWLGGLWGSGYCWLLVCGISGFAVLPVGD